MYSAPKHVLLEPKYLDLNTKMQGRNVDKESRKKVQTIQIRT
jgi:hypothetical protein